MKVREIDPTSPLFGHVRPGYRLVSLNGVKVVDSLDFQFRSADEQVHLKFADAADQVLEFEVDGLNDDLGLMWEEGDIGRCKCQCIFCFVHQQPKGMRRTLYIKDEDYRLSFTHGNFITLSNVSDREIERIIDQRLSPLYVSVHTTDDRLRREMLGNQKLVPINDQLKRLTDGGIELHTQVVLCPGINDGEHLDKTVHELASLHPKLTSLAVVPVGLTRYRQRLPQLRTYTTVESGQLIGTVHRWQRQFLKSLGTRFVWPADEFYVSAGCSFPTHASYEAMPQFENGVGMVREFVTRFNRRRRRLRQLTSHKRVLFVTGRSAWPVLKHEIWPFLTDEVGLAATLHPVTNRFWGDTVTVSGLLVGRDLEAELIKMAPQYDCIVLPPNCLNGDRLFLDDLSFKELQSALGCPVIVGKYDFVETIMEVFS
ncbi:MAG: DUF512 domain-containing protein [candidate division Zixibacteria bacterium]|nr:DUF512 domain-containing protein [candidate division Zixibacteria bacterium]MDH3938355.1 DUF512 domain-containing protein [candidate division Zixibacteria bacterium]MDH4032714.1 DUF512 domain-containing protein [candidate division Zixibacteria bacterium]